MLKCCSNPTKKAQKINSQALSTNIYIALKNTDSLF